MTPAIIVPSFNGAECLPNLIRALEVQTYNDFNVVVVLDGSNDNSKTVIEGMNSNLSIKIVEQENKGRSGARNAGVEHAKGDLLIFIDDDIRPAINFIQKHVDHHGEHSGSALTGRVQSDPAVAQTDFQRYLANRSGQWMDSYPKGKTQFDRQNLFFTGANCSISRKLFNDLHGFDESMSDSEDFELGTRLLDKGIEVYFDFDCLGWHDDLISLRQYILRQREYRKSWTAAAQSKPHLVSDYQRLDPHVPGGFRGFFFKLFAHPAWLNWTKSRLFLTLPVQLRYRIFDYIITSLGRYNTQVEIR